MLQIGFIRIKFCFISFCAAAAALRLAFLLQLNLTAVNHALHTLHLALKFKFYANFTQNDQRDSGAWHEKGFKAAYASKKGLNVLNIDWFSYRSLIRCKAGQQCQRERETVRYIVGVRER